MKYKTPSVPILRKHRPLKNFEPKRAYVDFSILKEEVYYSLEELENEFSVS